MNKMKEELAYLMNTTKLYAEQIENLKREKVKLNQSDHYRKSLSVENYVATKTCQPGKKPECRIWK